MKKDAINISTIKTKTTILYVDLKLDNNINVYQTGLFFNYDQSFRDNH